MKLLTTNFVQCAVKSCSQSNNAFPLKYEDCELVSQELEFDPQFVINVMSKLDWSAFTQVAQELGNTDLPSEKPEIDETNEQLLHDLHSLLLETQIKNVPRYAYYGKFRPVFGVKLGKRHPWIETNGRIRPIIRIIGYAGFARFLCWIRVDASVPDGHVYLVHEPFLP